MIRKSSGTPRSLLSACALSALLALSAAATAGEITGNGKSLKNDDGTLNGRSACAFSGLNDTPGEDGFGHTQSWGQLPKVLKEMFTLIGLHPGTACNPTKAEGEEPAN